MAEGQGPYFQLDDKYSCTNYSGKLHIVAKIAPNQYEVVYVNPATGQPSGHMILATEKPDLKTGSIFTDELWVKSIPHRNETVTLPTQDGFEHEYQVIRESSVCMAKSKESYKPPEKTVEIPKEETPKQEASAAQPVSTVPVEPQKEETKIEKPAEVPKEATVTQADPPKQAEPAQAPEQPQDDQ